MKSRNTIPEIMLQSQFRRHGIAVDTHVRSLPGTPDLVIADYRVAIFVNGCYWHRHFNCSNASSTARMSDPWLDHFAQVVSLDAHNSVRLHALGWIALTAWECEIKMYPNRVYRRIIDVVETRVDESC
jgi:DNA mismatch endonuclease, patch repair protein